MTTKIEYRIAQYGDLFYVQQRRKGWFFWSTWYDFPETRSTRRPRPIFDNIIDARKHLDENIPWRAIARRQQLKMAEAKPIVHYSQKVNW